jgi:glycopeptide antibiotics resistance protein
VVLVCLVTLWPFELSAERGVLQAKWARLTNFGRTGSSWPDIFVNFLLFVPLGGMFCMRLLIAGRSIVVVVPLVALAAFGFSLTIELTQLFVVGRLASWIDLVMNTSGALFGAVLGWFLARFA